MEISHKSNHGEKTHKSCYKWEKDSPECPKTEIEDKNNNQNDQRDESADI
jgi:hypothetical protein